MKKLYTLLSLLFVGTALMAQVTVTYKVDITQWLAGGGVLAPTGMKIGGNFAENLNTSNVFDWAPDSASSFLTQEGITNVWSKSITYPSSQSGLTQSFKFVNGTWGDNEGTAATTEIVTAGCGVLAGTDINRTIIIPTSNVTYEYCYDICTKCDGSPAVSGISDISSDRVEVGNAPNPFGDKTTITYSVAGSSKIVNLSVYDMTGRKINTLVNEQKAPGVYTTDFVATDAMSNGIYFYTLTSGTDVVSGKMSINR